MNLLLALGIWCGVALPVAVIVGKVLCGGTERAQRRVATNVATLDRPARTCTPRDVALLVRTRGRPARWLATAVAGLLLATASSSPAHASSQTSARYVGGLPASGPVLLLPQGSGPSYTMPNDTVPDAGGTWFAVPPGAQSMQVRVADDLSPNVVADVLFLIGEYAPLVPAGQFCGDSANLAIPAGADAGYVRVLTAESSAACAPPGTPTTGTIVIDFR